MYQLTGLPSYIYSLTLDKNAGKIHEQKRIKSVSFEKYIPFKTWNLLRTNNHSQGSPFLKKSMVYKDL